ncbi:fimbrial protein [Cedecea colo]|uniref:Type 1 fimbrial protein n=1 Tax=Cedecea colo TaxID=2552946 RepID=A0ABX0VNP3_9ENTR|nr:fimbrial protein [Cedecea colo]NIY47842.1 type 1 fimbrial protein [Cedecea colo]
MKTLNFSTLGCVIALAFSSVSAAHAADGTVNFTGTITDAGCNAFVNGSGAKTADVNLGKVLKSAFKGVGSTVDGAASTTGFTIELNDCPTTVTSATFKFDGENVNGDDKILALTAAEGAATGVGIQLYDKNRSILQLAKASAAYPIVNKGTGTSNVLPFYAKYIQTLGTVTTGPANAVATFTVNY